MIHLGEPAFFRAVYEDAFAKDAVLVEGVRSPITMRITRSYRWIAESRRLALVVQPPYPTQSASRAKIIHADLTGEEFERLWKGVPLLLKLLLYIGAPLYGSYQRWFGTRASLARGHSLEDLPSRKETLSWAPEYAAFDNAIRTARDKRLVEVMDAYLDEPVAEPRRLAIVYGASHMRAVIRELTKARRFHAVEGDWLMVFPLDNGDAEL